MTAAALAAALAFGGWLGIRWERTNTRLDHDLALLLLTEEQR